MRVRDPIILKGIAAAESAQELARKLGITPSALSQWDRVPHLRVLSFSEATGIPPHEVRPDLYPSHLVSPRSAA